MKYIPIRDTKDLGAAISRRRKSLRLTQQILADALGITRQSIGELESGKPGIRLEVAFLAARQLGIDFVLGEPE